ncbi:peptidoglycan DD-metalloendopeptidase family protein [Paraburkholderia acidisoli]|uniref:Peptidoglycan DD-metalloendopeptidase family protein n=1 Tax=Paraburkholderia acidisoli TaxID=2571748 RepID=A0A7Z2GS42_9BURK|nr:peptidoglycan DD-metalloendopeptidase family protein [Paraburkholderia acidisoli]QGZ66776.1 peptidoglycan DD-metalloendopeptidase family protein [Paraburkholderia acidisoli]
MTSAAWHLHRASLHANDDALGEGANVSAALPASAGVRSNAGASASDAASGPAVAKAAAEPPPYRVKTAVVEHSFSEAAQRLGLDAATTAQLTKAFAGRVDFRRDLQRGSEVSFVFRNAAGSANPQTNAQTNPQADTQTNAPASDARAAASTSTPTQPATSAGAASRTPVAVRISTGTASHDLFLYRNLAGKAFYYSADGHSAAPSFLRYPVKFTRISSHFALRRLDPVTHRIQPHEGVDLAAPVGTPVHATARGTVTWVGWKTGYGKVVMLDNFGPYSTTFAHLSRYAKHLKAGDSVRQGQVIGYVGATGWATGPHLHYEVHVDQVAQDPLTVDLPHRDPLRGADKQRFAQQVERLDALL